MDAMRARDEQGSGPATAAGATEREVVAVLMARIAAGEEDAIWELHELAGADLTRLVRAEARRLDLRLDADEVWELTLDAVEALVEVAAAWNPGGALPWVWAHHRVRAVVHRHVGTFARPLEDHLDLEAPPPAERIDDPLAVLRQAAERHPAARRLEASLTRVSERDAQIYLGVALERAGGNRAPAVTIGVDHGLLPATVRKVVQRVGEKVTQPVAQVA